MPSMAGKSTTPSRHAQWVISIAVTDQSFYPPVHSFFIAAAYALAGASLAEPVAYDCYLRLRTAVVGLAYLSGSLAIQITNSSTIGCPWPTAFAVAFALTSEVFVTLTVLAMLEMTGALFGLLLLLSIGQADRGEAQAIPWRRVIVAAVIAMLIFLTKYSFGLFTGSDRRVGHRHLAVAGRKSRLARSHTGDYRLRGWVGALAGSDPS